MSGITGPHICMLYVYIYHIFYIKHFKKTPSHFTLFYILISNIWLSSFSTSSPRLVTVCLSNYSHPSGCIAVSYHSTVGSVLLLVLCLWVQRDDCTMPFYTRTWTSLDFGIQSGSGTNPPWIQRDGYIYLHFSNC